ncbi:unnamed protein product [Mycena citricolor]|uniref:Uncharacterized protein n=1 Tax=Mycena citricolor TaxID=2018698 RepID=A0AAD2GXC8_9AGAR|nr:unnamed protein product [Mycena citricolor]
MRVKQIWEVLPLPSKVKLVWDRVTVSKLTVAYVVFSLAHFVIQIAFQIRAFTINANAATFLYNIALEGNATNSSVPALSTRPIVSGSGAALAHPGESTVQEVRMCAQVPTDLDTDECVVVYDGTPGRNMVYNPADPSASAPSTSTDSGYNYAGGAAPAPGSLTVIAASSSSAALSPVLSSVVTSTTPLASSTQLSAPSAPSVVVVTQIVTAAIAAPTFPPVRVADPEDVSENFYKRASIPSFFPEAKVLVLNDTTVQVNLTGMGYADHHLLLDKSCMWSLNWPVSILDDTKREDIVFIAFQFWVLGMSMVALLNESIPHIIASLTTHILATFWSGFQIWHTAFFRQRFDKVITHGACNGVPSLLPNYWQARAGAEIPILALNILALLASGILTWKLVKLFGWQTFKRVGASLTINRVYKLVLLLSISMQLSFFFMGATLSLFVDQLFNGTAGHLAWYIKMYKVTFILTAVMLIPWLVTGWFSVRRESRIGMVVFLALSMMYLAGFCIMFLSTTFRWTFVTWNFFAIVSTVSAILTLMSFVLGIVCQCNFGKGLLRYLNAQEPLPGDDFESVTPGDDPEKVAFPSNEKPVPTFSATFGSGSEVPVPSQMFKPTAQLGPRFFNNGADPFESRRSSPISPPAAALTRTLTRDSYEGSGNGMGGIPTKRDSDGSFGSLDSYYDYSSGDSRHARRDSEGPTVGQSKRWVIE